MFSALIVAGIIVGYRKAQGDSKKRWRLWYIPLAILWYAGTMATYPSFMADHGNGYIHFALLMIVVAGLVLLSAALASWTVYSYFSRLSQERSVFKANY